MCMGGGVCVLLHNNYYMHILVLLHYYEHFQINVKKLYSTTLIGKACMQIKTDAYHFIFSPSIIYNIYN